MFDGKFKAVTFSFDDGNIDDVRLIELLKKYGLKATFNLNSQLLGTSGFLNIEGVRVDNIKHKPEDIKYVYDGHEVAAHTLTHPKLTQIEDEKLVGGLIINYEGKTIDGSLLTKQESLKEYLKK